jgi:hypothetical protein
MYVHLPAENQLVIAYLWRELLEQAVRNSRQMKGRFLLCLERERREGERGGEGEGEGERDEKVLISRTR